MFAKSSNGGANTSVTGITTIVTPVTPHWTGIVGSVLRTVGESDHLLFSAPSNPKERSHLQLWESTDEGTTWKATQVLFQGLSGYSDLVNLGSSGKSIGMIFENGDATFADRISFVQFDLE